MEGLPKKRRSDEKRPELGEIRDLDMHFSNLHDEDEDRAGERFDPATGRRINNSTDQGFFNRDISADVIVDDLNAPPDNEEDEAARWLRQNDPNNDSK